MLRKFWNPLASLLMVIAIHKSIALTAEAIRRATFNALCSKLRTNNDLSITKHALAAIAAGAFCMAVTQLSDARHILRIIPDIEIPFRRMP